MTALLQSDGETASTSRAGFQSILFERSDDKPVEELVEAPDFFRDLNLDQIVNAITAGREEYNLKPFFHSRLTDIATVAYRQAIMRDLEKEVLFESVKTFSNRMRTVRQYLAVAEKVSYKEEAERWFLESVERYAEAIEELLQALDEHEPKSGGLRSFRGYLAGYVESSRFRMLIQQAKELNSRLSAIRYCLLLKDNSVTVRRYESEIDYSAAVEEVFAKFKQGAVKDYRAKVPAYSGLNHVEASILERVAQLNPEVFLALDEFCTENKRYFNQAIVQFDREVQFYIAYLEYTETFKRASLAFCYPQVSDTCQEVNNSDGFDLALAGKLLHEKSPVVCNDFFLTGGERILVVSGPNQGGKTTFARTFGQLHYLASLGCPVPGTKARLFLFDRLFTHFEREENITTLSGKLEDDLIRIHRILGQATPKSIILINEILSSTSVKDALYLGRKLIERISRLNALCVCVTFLDELSSLNERTVSVVATVVPDNPTLRTYRLERRPADGLAYALAIAEKYRLTYKRLKERMDTNVTG